MYGCFHFSFYTSAEGVRSSEDIPESWLKVMKVKMKSIGQFQKKHWKSTLVLSSLKTQFLSSIRAALFSSARILLSSSPLDTVLTNFLTMFSFSYNWTTLSSVSWVVDWYNISFDWSESRCMVVFISLFIPAQRVWEVQKIFHSLEWNWWKWIKFKRTIIKKKHSFEILFNCQ